MQSVTSLDLYIDICKTKLSLLSRAFEIKIVSTFFHTRCSIADAQGSIVNKVVNKNYLGEILLRIAVFT